MANKIIGINLNGVDYDYEDEETSSKTEENTSKIGDLSNLETTAKTDLVSAINEVVSASGGFSIPPKLVYAPAGGNLGVQNVGVTWAQVKEWLGVEEFSELPVGLTLWCQMSFGSSQYTPTAGWNRPIRWNGTEWEDVIYDGTATYTRLYSWGIGFERGTNTTKYIMLELEVMKLIY